MCSISKLFGAENSQFEFDTLEIKAGLKNGELAINERVFANLVLILSMTLISSNLNCLSLR